MVQVKVSKPDGSPAVNESILVTARDHGNEIYLEKVFSTNHMGEIDYSICQGIMEKISALSVFVSHCNWWKTLWQSLYMWLTIEVFAKAFWKRHSLHFNSKECCFQVFTVKSALSPNPWFWVQFRKLLLAVPVVMVFSDPWKRKSGVKWTFVGTRSKHKKVQMNAYFNTDTQYANFRGNPLYQATKRH